jgi:hypothetical protein
VSRESIESIRTDVKYTQDTIHGRCGGLEGPRWSGSWNLGRNFGYLAGILGTWLVLDAYSRIMIHDMCDSTLERFGDDRMRGRRPMVESRPRIDAPSRQGTCSGYLHADEGHWTVIEAVRVDAQSFIRSPAIFAVEHLRVRLETHPHYESRFTSDSQGHTQVQYVP